MAKNSCGPQKTLVKEVLKAVGRVIDFKSIEEIVIPIVKQADKGGMNCLTSIMEGHLNLVHKGLGIFNGCLSKMTDILFKLVEDAETAEILIDFYCYLLANHSQNSEIVDNLDSIYEQILISFGELSLVGNKTDPLKFSANKNKRSRKEAFFLGFRDDKHQNSHNFEGNTRIQPKISLFFD